MEPLILFAHGAGVGPWSPWMERWAHRLATIGPVVRFAYPYMQQGRKAPNPLPVLLAAHRAAFDEARARHRGRRIVLAGKSMGGRVSCHLAEALAAEPGMDGRSDADEILGVVCFGYPLIGASKKNPVRDTVLLQLAKPVLFCQGSADPMCPLELLDDVRRRMTVPSDVVVVDGGDHSLEVGVRALEARGSTQDAEDDRVLGAVRSFLSRL